MNEQLVNALIAALREQTAAQREQTEAINRLAESNVALSDVIIQSLAGDLDEIGMATAQAEAVVATQFDQILQRNGRLKPRRFAQIFAVSLA